MQYGHVHEHAGDLPCGEHIVLVVQVHDLHQGQLLPAWRMMAVGMHVEHGVRAIGFRSLPYRLVASIVLDRRVELLHRLSALPRVVSFPHTRNGMALDIVCAGIPDSFIAFRFGCGDERSPRWLRYGHTTSLQSVMLRIASIGSEEMPVSRKDRGLGTVDDGNAAVVIDLIFRIHGKHAIEQATQPTWFVSLRCL